MRISTAAGCTHILVQGFFQHWGDIRSILPLDSFPDRLIVQIEFYDTRAAERIISQVHEQVYQVHNGEVYVYLY